MADFLEIKTNNRRKFYKIKKPRQYKKYYHLKSTLHESLEGRSSQNDF